jgi:hypothetical protein
MSGITFVAVLAALGIAYAVGVRAKARSNAAARPDRPAVPPSREEAEHARERNQASLNEWCAILEQRRDLTDEEQQRYRDFVALARAAKLAAFRGRGFTPSEREEAVRWRDAKVAEAETARAELGEAAEAWEQERSAGQDGPAGTRVRDLTKRYERCLRDAGEVNKLRAWRKSLTGTADNLCLDELLTGEVLGDLSGPLTPAERAFMDASVSTRLGGDRSSMDAALAALERQNGGPNLTLAQSERIAAELDRQANSEEKLAKDRAMLDAARQAARDADVRLVLNHPDEDPEIAGRLAAADAAWGQRMQELLSSDDFSSGPAELGPEEEKTFRAFTIARRAALVAQRSGRPGSRFTAEDHAKAAEICNSKATDARALMKQLQDAHAEWDADMERTGRFVSPAGDRVQSLSQHLEDLAFDGGHFNMFAWALCWRRVKGQFQEKRKAAGS